MKFLALIRSILFTLYFPFSIIFFGIIVIIVHVIFRSKKIDDMITSFWSRMCCWLSGVTVEVEGAENIPDRGCIIVFNHSSFYDVFAISGYLRQVRFGAKAELFKVPIFSQAMRAVGTLPISRDNRDEVYKIYEEAKARFAKKEKFALSAEGGRFYGKELSQFKAGPFNFAMNANVPILPVVVVGAYEAMPKGDFLFNKNNWNQKIKLIVLPPVSTDGYSHENRLELRNKIYQQMNQLWVKHFGKL